MIDFTLFFLEFFVSLFSNVFFGALLGCVIALGLFRLVFYLLGFKDDNL